MDDLKRKIKDKTAKIAIVGLGYVGLPLSMAFCDHNFKVTGIDINKDKVNKLKSNISYIGDISSDKVKKAIESGKFKITSGYEVLKEQDVAIICVPTPLGKTKEPDISFIISSVKSISKYMHKEQLVVLESTTYPGTTREEILPILQKSGLKLDKDFYLAFSPERVNPGSKNFRPTDIPKVIGAVSEKSKEIAASLYEQVFKKVVRVSSAEIAEMSKLLENTFRSVNIGLINEITLMCNKLGIDVWQVIEAAKTKPFGFMPFYPGPGLGGHCLPTDPMYLSWKARVAGFEARLIDVAHQINSSMPEYVVSKTTDALNTRNKSINSSKILIVGLSYKKDVSDTRESPALNIISLLINKGAEVYYYDPYLAEYEINNRKYKSVDLTAKNLSNKDCVIIATDHSNIDYSLIAQKSRLIIDTRNVFKNINVKKEKLVKI